MRESKSLLVAVKKRNRISLHISEYDDQQNGDSYYNAESHHQDCIASEIPPVEAA